MSVTILKQAEVVVDTVEVLAYDIAERVDAFGSASEELKAKMDELQPLQNLVNELKKSFVEEASEEPVDQAVMYVGSEFAIKLSKQASSVVAINKAELVAALGDDTYLELSSVGVGDIRKYCTPPQLDKILTEEPVGARRVKLEKI